MNRIYSVFLCVSVPTEKIQLSVLLIDAELAAPLCVLLARQLFKGYVTKERRQGGLPTVGGGPFCGGYY